MTAYSHYKNLSIINKLAMGKKGEEVDVSIGEFVIPGEITDISTAGSTFVVSPYAGTIDKIYSVLEGNITTAATAAITFEIGGTPVSSGAHTIGGASAECLAGVVDYSTPTGENTIAAGGAIELITDGGSFTSTAGGTTINPGNLMMVCTRT